MHGNDRITVLNLLTSIRLTVPSEAPTARYSPPSDILSRVLGTLHTDLVLNTQVQGPRNKNGVISKISKTKMRMSLNRECYCSVVPKRCSGDFNEYFP